MARTLLVGTSRSSWREWIKTRLGGRDLLVLDPSDPNQNSLARLVLVRDEKVVSYRFVGSLDATRNPIAVLQGLVELLAEAKSELVIQCFNYRPQPVARQLLIACAQMIRPDEVIIAEGAKIPMNEWPVGPHSCELEPNFPEMVQSAQRRARWLELLERSSEHVVNLGEVSIFGTRLGSGTRISPERILALGLEGVLWAESLGPNALVVAKKAPTERQIGDLLNLAHASKVIVVDPMAYSGRVCSFARQNGEDFGMGMIEELDFVHGAFRIMSPSVPPAPVRILKLGTLVIDSSGREIQDDKPWAL